MEMFNEDGYLEPGFHDLDINEVEDKFVNNFKDSITRKDILNGYINYIKELKNCGIDKVECWIDGSFSTNKTNPNDIDMVVVVDKDILDNIPEDKRVAASELLNPKLARIKYKCDAYLIIKTEKGHSGHGQYANNRSYWRGWFAFDRNEIPKGIIRIDIAKEVG